MKQLSFSIATTVSPYLLVALGGIGGTKTRFLVDTVVPGALVATMIVNIVGSFALGLLLYGDIYTEALTNRSRLLFGTGFISSFTTFSTFIIDIISVEPLLAVAYILTSYGLGFLGIFLGHAIAKWLVT